jgi:hypothetical protein
MKQVTLLTFLALALISNTNAQNKKNQDQKAIKSMCGCYEVGFNFAETFQYSNDTNYKPSPVKHEKGLEWVQLVEDSENKIVMQHLLIVGKPDRQHIVKHWRQDWVFENTDLYSYHANNIWKYSSLPKAKVKGQWTQKVFQVDDSPRYEGSATWIHADGKSYWENTTDAPLPRREHTIRKDYNVIERTNKHEIVTEGWIHDQDNKKVVRKNGEKDVVLAEEKGFDTYTKVDDSYCKAAQEWWKKNQADWVKVRAKWDAIFNKKQDLSLETSVDGKQLFDFLLSEDFLKTEDNINKTIDAFIK